MNISAQLAQIIVFINKYSLVSPLKKMSCPFMSPNELPRSKLRGIEKIQGALNPDAEHRGILSIKFI
jgi:hypothetical protein